MAKKPRNHRWVDDACVRCGLHRRETWVRDGAGRPVMALVWSDRHGAVRVQPFPQMLGLSPPTAPTQTLEEAFPGVPVGREPRCEDEPSQVSDAAAPDSG